MLTNMFTILQGILVHVNQNVCNQGILVHVNQHVYNLTGDPSTC